MSKFIKTQELLELLTSEFEKFKTGSFAIEDFEKLLEHSRELHERMLILRYKAFEKFKMGGDFADIQEEIPKKVIEPQNQIVSTEETAIEEEEPETQDSDALDMDSGFDFALFDEIQESKEELPLVEEKPEPNIPVAEEPQTFQKSEPVEEKATSHLTEQARPSSLHDQFATSSSNRLEDRLNNSKISSISAALNLNDRIRFTKNLFGGNAETFNKTVQALDNLNSISEAQVVLKTNASSFEWDEENEVTMAFYKLVERRYA